MLMFLTWNEAGKLNLTLHLWTLWRHPGTHSRGRVITQSRGSSPEPWSAKSQRNTASNMAQRTVIQDFYPNGNMSKVNVQSEVWEDTSQERRLEQKICKSVISVISVNL